jgi:hypothetical protein
VIHAQLVVHRAEASQGIVAVGVGDPLELVLVDADQAERLPEFC